MKTRKKLLSRCVPFILVAGAALPLNAQVFVIGDGFASDGSGSFDLSQGNGNGSDSGTTSTNGSAGNTVESVYIASSGTPASPFDSSFNPIAVGDVFGSDYGATINFDLSLLDLSAISAPPAGQKYQISSIELFLELSFNAIDGASADVDVYTNTGFTAGGFTQPADTTFTIINGTAAGEFLPSILLSTDAIDLGNQNNFEISLDITDVADGVTFGSSLSTAADPNSGIGGTTVVQVAPRLRITTELVAVPEPSTFAFLSLFSLCVISRRNRK